MKPKPDAPTVLKMTMPEVFDAFVTLEMGEHEMLVTAVNVFGIAEEKPLHSRSDYNIFRMVSLHMPLRYVSDASMLVDTVHYATRQ